jgi:hypothetical protein
MPEAPPSQNSSPKVVVVETWSAIVPGDFGLKAGYYPEAEGDSVLFRPLLGWITVTARGLESGTQRNDFIGVVMSPLSAPVPATLLRGYLGVFPITMAPHEAWEFSARWRPPGETSLKPPAQEGREDSALDNMQRQFGLHLVPPLPEGS